MMGPDAYAYRPDYAMPPGQTLRDTLEGLGMSQADLARRTGLSTKHVNQIVQGVAAVTPETALALEHVTGVPARLWNALEANYRQRQMRLKQQELSLEDRAWLRTLPAKALIERGVIPSPPDDGSLFESMLRFFGVASREAWHAVWMAPEAAFRRSPVFAGDPGATAAWLRLGEIRATEMLAGTYDRAKFRIALDEIRNSLLKHPRHTVLLAERLTLEAGVLFVVVPEVPGTRASGAARWLAPTRPLIQLSLRYAWEDSFWFSFFHEAGHLLLHGKRELFVDDDQPAGDAEHDADTFAGRVLIPPRYEPELLELETLAEVQTFARRVKLPPGIVVGRLQREGRLDHAVGNRLRHRLRLASDGQTIDRL